MGLALHHSCFKNLMNGSGIITKFSLSRCPAAFFGICDLRVCNLGKAANFLLGVPQGNYLAKKSESSAGNSLF